MCLRLVVHCAFAALAVGCGVASPLAGDLGTEDELPEQNEAARDAGTADAMPPGPGDDTKVGEADDAQDGSPPCGTGVGCDPTDLGGESCASLGLGDGMLLCDPTSCTFVVSLCMGLGTDVPRLGPPCGTGPGCDPADLGDATCESLGLGGGMLSCDPLTCMFDTSMCDRAGGGGGMGGGMGASFGGGGFLGGLFGTGGSGSSDAGP
jgi:hypothetical protein